MERQIKPTRAQLSSIETQLVATSSDTQLFAFIKQQAATHALRYALAHCDDGVTFGAYINSDWQWGNSAFPEVCPPVQMRTLRELRIFGDSAELFVWRGGSAFAARMCVDVATGAAYDHFDEQILLSGAIAGNPVAGFCLMREGAQGLLHAPPTAIAKTGKLMFRHYLNYDAAGCIQTVAQRLVAPAQEQA